MSKAQTFDVLIIGAGAAGLMCAREAGKRGRRVAILERAGRIGKKILISGGGRCNFTNLHCQPEHFLSANPHFAKSALARYTPADFVALVESHGVAYHEKKLGQLFCDNSARDIVSMLEAECRRVGAQIILNSSIQEVKQSSEFVVRTDGAEYRAAALVVATGGLTLPKIGATSFGYDLARQFGLSVRSPRPALVPLVLDSADQDRYGDLSGVSVDVIATTSRHSFREKMLFTHHGLSGPAILQVSSYWRKGEAVAIDLAPGQEVGVALSSAKTRNAKAALSILQQLLPSRVAARWIDLFSPSTLKGEAWNNEAIREFEQRLHNWHLTPSDTAGYEKAEVTAGGVDTGELSGKTMESRRVRGLFFIGEVVDVTGQLGGFNFQWAWASGAAAGRAA